MHRNVHTAAVERRCFIRKKRRLYFSHRLALKKSVPIHLNEMVRRPTRMRANLTLVPILWILEFVLQVHEIIEVLYEVWGVVIVVVYRQSWCEDVSAVVMHCVENVKQHILKTRPKSVTSLHASVIHSFLHFQF
jgi:hypothetical protein